MQPHKGCSGSFRCSSGSAQSARALLSSSTSQYWNWWAGVEAHTPENSKATAQHEHPLCGIQGTWERRQMALGIADRPSGGSGWGRQLEFRWRSAAAPSMVGGFRCPAGATSSSSISPAHPERPLLCVVHMSSMRPRLHMAASYDIGRTSPCLCSMFCYQMKALPCCTCGHVTPTILFVHHGIGTYDIMRSCPVQGSSTVLRLRSQPHLELPVGQAPAVVRDGEAAQHLRQRSPLRALDGEQGARRRVAPVAAQP